MEIIDAHAHIYPEKIAQKATVAIGEFYNIPMEMPVGTAEKLIEEGKEAGVNKFVVHSVATTAHQVRSINDFIKKEVETHKEFIGFMTLHQDLSEEEVYEEVNRCTKSGFKGVKLHPDFQKFYIDGENAQKFYKIIGDKLPILFHIGDDRYDFSKPERLAKMAKKYPQVKFIAAHFGGYRCWQEVEVYKDLKNIYFDTCSSLAFISAKKAKELIEQFGAERFFFATDFPMWSAKEEIERFNKIELTEMQRQMIFSLNLKKLLNI